MIDIDMVFRITVLVWPAIVFSAIIFELTFRLARKRGIKYGIAYKLIPFLLTILVFYFYGLIGDNVCEPTHGEWDLCGGYKIIAMIPSVFYGCLIWIMYLFRERIGKV